MLLYPQLPQIRLLPYTVYPAEINMAMDSFLLDSSGTTLRFYGWEHPTLSFGRMNQKTDEIDLDFCQKRGVRMVQRISGGKTVLHHHELTYSFISDTAHFPLSVVETYRMISQILSDCFQQYGLNPQMSADKGKSSATSICFKEASAFELTINDKKLVGSAQYRKRKRFFQHGSILLDIDWQTWKKVWKLPETCTELEERVTSFKSELGCAPEPAELADAISNTFADRFKGRLIRDGLTKGEWRAVQEISSRYRWGKPSN